MTDIHKAVLKREIEGQLAAYGWCDVLEALAIIAEEDLNRLEKEAEEAGEEILPFVQTTYDKMIRRLTHLNQIAADM